MTNSETIFFAIGVWVVIFLLFILLGIATGFIKVEFKFTKE